MAELDRWWRKAGAPARQRLFFSEADLTAQPDVHYAEEDYPGRLDLRGAQFELKYRFAPGEPDDGVSVQVPMGMLSALVAEALEWSVPGLFALVCEQWLKSLPKSKRRLLAPVPDRVAEMLPRLLKPGRYREGRLDVALAEVAHDLFGVRITAEDWSRDRIDVHLLMNVQVLDSEGHVVAQGRDVEALKAQFASAVEARMAGGLRDSFERSGLTRWPDDLELPESQVLDDPAGQVVVYPALVDGGDHVDLRLLASAEAQADANRRGFARLALLELGQTARHLKKRLDRERDLGLRYASLGDARTLHDEVLRGSVWYCLFEDQPLPRDARAFRALLSARRGALTGVFEQTLEAVRRILEARFAIVRTLDAMTSPAYRSAMADVREQLARLVPAELLAATPRAMLAAVPRYLDAVSYRLEHLQGRVQRDAEQTADVAALQARLERLRSVPGMPAARWQTLRFLIEELRIGLFAEPLGTRGKVSLKRVRQTFLATEREFGLA
ncbi:MAG: DUF3418 domain-containing protein [Pseudomonadales bacterium]